MMDQMLVWTMLQREIIGNDRRFAEAHGRAGEYHAPGGIFRTIWDGFGHPVRNRRAAGRVRQG